MLTRRNLRAKVLQSLYAYYEAERESVTVATKRLQGSIDKVYELSFWHLSFFENIVDSIKKRQEDAKNKFLPSEKDLSPDTKFIDNEFINFLIDSRDLNTKLGRFKIRWNDTDELVRRISDNIIISPYYKNFLSIDNPTKRDAFMLYKDVFLNIISKDSGYKSFFEEQYLDWATWEDSKIVTSPRPLSNEYFSAADREYLFKLIGGGADLESIQIEEKSVYTNMLDYYNSVNFAVKMLTFVEEQPHVNFSFPPMYENSVSGQEHQDLSFAKKLLTQTIVHDAEFYDIISARIKNWDIERLTLTDIILMKMAMTEFIDFPTIPVKATINEYIELSKVYGTTKSSGFVNGLLDRIMNDFKEEDKIKKQGRGLIG